MPLTLKDIQYRTWQTSFSIINDFHSKQQQIKKRIGSDEIQPISYLSTLPWVVKWIATNVSVIIFLNPNVHRCCSCRGEQKEINDLFA